MGGFFKKKPILNSVQFECKTTMGRKKNFENSLRSPSSFQKNVLICHKSVLLKSELHTGQTGILLSIDCLFFLNKMTKQKTNFGVHGHVHVTSSRECFFYNNYFSHQFNHQNVSWEKQLALSSGFCFYNNSNNKNRKKY